MLIQSTARQRRIRLNQVILQQKTCSVLYRSLISLCSRPAGKRAASRLAVAALFTTLPVTTYAAQTERYLIDSAGNVVMSPTAGVCVHTSEWKPGTGIPPCDPEAAKQVVAPAAPAPKAVAAPKPAPAPKPAVAQAPPPQKISFSADVLFDFNKAVLKTTAAKPLDEVVKLLNNATFSAISVVGHTDRLGRPEYNQKLSQKRARAVADYLVSHGIASDKVRAEGRGETQPQTKAAACKGLSRAKQITCLQPDRRVDVEVSGTKPAI